MDRRVEDEEMSYDDLEDYTWDSSPIHHFTISNSETLD